MAQNIETVPDKKISEALDEDFHTEIKEVEEEIRDLETLYVESKQLVDSVKASKHRGSLTFVQMQTANLIAIKNAKISAIKSKAQFKGQRFDQEYKKAVKELGGGNNSVPVAQLIHLLVANDIEFRKAQSIFIEESDGLDAAVEIALDGDDTPVSTEIYLEKKGDIGMESVPKQDKEFEVKNDTYEIVSDMNGNIFIVDNNGSTERETVFIERETLGIGPEEKATISSSDGGAPLATFRGTEIEIVNIDEEEKYE